MTTQRDHTTAPTAGQHPMLELGAHLWRGGTFAYWWGLSPDGEMQTAYFDPAAPSKPPAAWAEWNQYFGVNPIHTRGKRATAKDVAAVNCLFADFDAKDHVTRGELAPFRPPDYDAMDARAQRDADKAAQVAAMVADLPTYKARALATVDACPLRPTWIVDTGGGYQCYWLLRDTLPIDDANRAQWEALQAAWGTLFDPPPAAKDLPRVLRMIGSANVKRHFTRPPIVTVVERDDSRLYTPADFELLTGVDDAYMAAKAAKPKPREGGTDDVIARYNAAVRVGDLLTRNGYTPGQARGRMERYSRPGANEPSQTSVIVWTDANRSYHHSSRDDLYCGDAGGGGHSRDAFDVLTHLEHGGDTGAAYVAAKKDLGMWEDAPRPKRATAYTNGTGPHYDQGEYGAPLPTIEANNRQLGDLTDKALAALVEHNARTPTAPGIYTRGGALERLIPGAGIQSVTKDALAGILARAAQWISVRTTKDGEKKTVNVFPPAALTAALHANGTWPGLPELRGLLTCPSYVGTGWVDKPGYDAGSGLFLLDGTDPGDTTPTAAAVAWARGMLLDELLGDFPFVDQASRAHALALTLIGFVRHGIRGATPMHLVDAPTPGSGKGLLVAACTVPALGGDIASMAPGRDDEEVRKRLTSHLASGATHVNLDNLTGRLDSPVLAMALTQPVWQDRPLGLTHMLTLPVTTIWSATANNVRPSDEIARRCAWIRIDPEVERPHERTDFRHPDLLRWARDNRAQLVRAAVIIVRNWQARGYPLGKYAKGSFEEWAGIMGGILDCAGVPGFLANDRELFDTAVSELGAWRAFVAAWAEAHGDAPVGVKALFFFASHHDGVVAPGTSAGMGLLDDILGGVNEAGRRKSLGRNLAQMADRVIGGWKITRGSLRDGEQQWRLRPAKDGAQA